MDFALTSQASFLAIGMAISVALPPSSNGSPKTLYLPIQNSSPKLGMRPEPTKSVRSVPDTACHASPVDGANGTADFATTLAASGAPIHTPPAPSLPDCADPPISTNPTAAPPKTALTSSLHTTDSPSMILSPTLRNTTKKTVKITATAIIITSAKTWGSKAPPPKKQLNACDFAKSKTSWQHYSLAKVSRC